MASRVAAEGGDVFAATFPWAATLYMQDAGGTTGLPAGVATATNLEEMNGTADSTIPICGLTNSSVTVSSVDTTLNWWMSVLGCSIATPSSSVCVGGQPVLTAKTLSGCNNGSHRQLVIRARCKPQLASGLERHGLVVLQQPQKTLKT